MTFLVKERVRLMEKRKVHAASSIGQVTVCGKALKRKWPLKIEHPDSEKVTCGFCRGILKLY